MNTSIYNSINLMGLSREERLDKLDEFNEIMDRALSAETDEELERSIGEMKLRYFSTEDTFRQLFIYDKNMNSLLLEVIKE